MIKSIDWNFSHGIDYKCADDQNNIDKEHTQSPVESVVITGSDAFWEEDAMVVEPFDTD